MGYAYANIHTFAMLQKCFFFFIEFNFLSVMRVGIFFFFQMIEQLIFGTSSQKKILQYESFKVIHRKLFQQVFKLFLKEQEE